MAQPDVKSLITRGPLPNVSIAYHNTDYIGDRVYPIIDKVSARAQIAKYYKGDFYRNEARVRAPGDQASRGGFRMEMVDINTVEIAKAREVNDEDVRDALDMGAPPIQPASDGVEWASQMVDLRKEIDIAASIFAGTWSGVSGGEDAEGLWAPSGSNTFIVDVNSKIEYIRINTGFKPNVLMIDGTTMNGLLMEATLIDRIKYVEKSIISTNLIAALFQLDEVLIGDAIKNTALEKSDEDSFTGANIWEKNAGKGSAFLYYRPKRPGLKTVSAGYQARRAYKNGKARRVSTWRDESRHQSMYEVAEDTGIVQTGSDLGYLWVDTFAT